LAKAAAAGIVIALYGSLIWALRPFQGHVSWLGRLFGLLGGVEAARLLARRKLPRSSDLELADPEARTAWSDTCRISNQR